DWLSTLVNHKAPSGPAVIPTGPEIVGSVKMVISPLAVMRPIELLPGLVKHRGPSGPRARGAGARPRSGGERTSPGRVRRPIEPLPGLVNHSGAASEPPADGLPPRPCVPPGPTTMP